MYILFYLLRFNQEIKIIIGVQMSISIILIPSDNTSV